MNKKNKMLMIGAAILALCIFTVTAVASTSNTAGYDAFKEILKAQHVAGQTIESSTINGSFIIKADGETVMQVDGTMKAGDAGETISGDFNLSLMGVERSASVYASEDDKFYFVDHTHDLHYQVINVEEDDDYDYDFDIEDRPMRKSEEALLDFIVGDLKKNFSVNNHSDGSKTIVFDVNKEDVPLPMRLLVDIVTGSKTNKHVHTEALPAEWRYIEHLPFFQGLDAAEFAKALPEMTEDVVIDRIHLKMTFLENNELQGIQGTFKVSGKDEAGVSHIVEVAGEGRISDMNQTMPDVYDPAGRSIEIIDAQELATRN